jgi:hypothetical protein
MSENHRDKLPENKHKEGLGFAPSARMTKPSGILEPIEDTFCSAGFIHSPPEINVIVEDKVEEEPPSFVTPGGICRNWVAVDVPSATPLSK